ncbi:uncharacterized protein LOC111367851 [Olea europaea subsp. europaea]|uniref:Uncharacterized protein LOC111367851 n=1 Tax=Olea europaea subsp. europaea TaxID=158383 RepID=A0A8S0UAA2_OLEEU|nr:uncharacterized protein LOC111367851 [Olea europaea subsp. europaea]
MGFISHQEHFLLGSVTFEGQCKGSMTFIFKGTLKAPIEHNKFSTDTWISFRSLDDLTVKSGGYLDGQEDDYFEIEKSAVEVVQSQSPSEELSHQTLPLLKPPARFVLDDQGRLLMASYKRIATVMDSTNNFPLECIIRREFRNSKGDECMLLCPVDMPIQILKSVNVEGCSASSDKEVEAILPTTAYTLSKIQMHLVCSGRRTDDDIIEFHTDNGQDVDGLPTECVEIACFHLDGSHYMIYTPSDLLLFVVVKDENGALQMADDQLLDDPAIISAIDEETEFNALVICMRQNLTY